MYKRQGRGGIVEQIRNHNPYDMNNKNPYAQLTEDVGLYLTGRIPYDSYRGRTAYPERLNQKGDIDELKAFGWYEWQQMGGSVIYNPWGPQRYADTTIEKLLHYPGFNILGTFLKITDYGHEEQKKKK